MRTRAATTERPIIMSADSVRAILDGRKTQTRRVIKPQPERTTAPSWCHSAFFWWTWKTDVKVSAGALADNLAAACPYPVGSRLWVREKWSPYADEDTRIACQCGDQSLGYTPSPCVYAAEYDDDAPCIEMGGSEEHWRSPIFMPRWASRITLEVVGVRAERLQDITHNDICMEGWDPIWSRPFGNGTAGDDARAWYAALWDRINARRGLANQNGDIAWLDWASNPWVWVVEFKRIGGEG